MGASERYKSKDCNALGNRLPITCKDHHLLNKMVRLPSHVIGRWLFDRNSLRTTLCGGIGKRSS